MNNKLELLGYCGLYCGACTFYNALLPDGKNVLEDAVNKGYIRREGSCTGCQEGRKLCISIVILGILKNALSARKLNIVDYVSVFHVKKLLNFRIKDIPFIIRKL